MDNPQSTRVRKRKTQNSIRRKIMMKTRWMALGLATVMLSGSLVGCGNNATQVPAATANDTDNEVKAEGTTVTFWNAFTGADGDMLLQCQLFYLL